MKEITLGHRIHFFSHLQLKSKQDEYLEFLQSPGLPEKMSSFLCLQFQDLWIKK